MHDGELPLVEIISNTDAAAALLKPPRPALLAALQEADSAAGLAKRLEMPRQRLNHHLRELERVGLLELVEERRRGNFTERVLRATARRYLMAPEILEELGSFAPQDLNEFRSWTSLAASSAQTLSHLVALRKGIPDPPTLTVPSRLRFSSEEALNAFTLELTEELGRLVRKYHDENAAVSYWFVLGAYPDLDVST